jgi:hypothetical protein
MVTIPMSEALFSRVKTEFMDEGEYFRIEYSGVRTFPKIIALIDEVEAHSVRTGVYKYLFDLRESEEGFSLVDKYNLGIHLARVFGLKYTVAALIKREQITGFLENVSLNRGAARFRITDSEAEAIAHLNANPIP